MTARNPRQLASTATMIAGSTIALAALGAAAALAAWTIPSILRHDRESPYAIMLLAPGGFFLGLVAVFGLYMALQGRRFALGR